MNLRGLLVGAIALGLSSNANAQFGSVSLDEVCGEYGTDSIVAGTQITFNIRFTNNTSFAVSGFTNGFEISSPNGATWGTAVGELVESQGPSWFDGGIFLHGYGVSGSQADTLTVAGFKIFGSGMPPGYDEIFYKIIIGPIPNGQDGLHICLDSAWFPPNGPWLWSLSGGPSGPPSWSGPHCFTVYELPCNKITGEGCGQFPCQPENCCLLRGDADHDGMWSVSDLTYLVDYLFRGGPPPPCPQEADVNADGEINVADITDFILFLFGGGPGPPPCD